MDREEERAVLEDVVRGQKERFEAIVRHYQSRAQSIAVGLVGNRHDALDLSQDAFLRAFRAIRTFDLEQPFFPWFYRILRNVCLSHLKRRKRTVSLHAISRKDDEEVEVQIPDSTPGPDVLAEASEEQLILYAAIESLPVKDREILHLRHLQDLSYAQIAGALEIPVGTVMSRLFYARRRLRERLDQEDLEG